MTRATLVAEMVAAATAHRLAKANKSNRAALEAASERERKAVAALVRCDFPRR